MKGMAGVVSQVSPIGFGGLTIIYMEDQNAVFQQLNTNRMMQFIEKGELANGQVLAKEKAAQTNVLLCK